MENVAITIFGIMILGATAFGFYLMTINKKDLKKEI